jgi:pyruvate kinase
MRKAKIIATLGPATSEISILTDLIKAGINVVRVNMSHGSYETHKQVIANVRKASRDLNREVAILLDLQGPKIRVDKLEKELELKSSEEWVIGATKIKDTYPEYAGKFIPTMYENLVKDCHDGARVLFDDGKIVAKALKKDRDVYKIKIEVGGILKSNKGINLPDCQVSAPSFTKKDKEDLLFALREGIDYVALSFVREKKDVKDLKALLHSLKINIPVVAKIEKPQAVKNFDEILTACDVIMVARGDLAVEVGDHLVPSIQKKIIKKCNELGKPVITATQMLESMILNPSPTRAEASDVANAIFDGTDAVMLSAETASGKYPLESVKMMAKIVEDAEAHSTLKRPFENVDFSNINTALSQAVASVAEKVGAVRILAMTQSGHSCLKISRFRPSVPIIGITNNIETVRRICLYWGVTPFLVKDFGEDNNLLKDFVINLVRESLNLKNGDRIVISRGDGPFFSGGTANSLQVEIIKTAPKLLGSSDTIESVSDSKKTIKLDTHICASCQNCIAICPHDIWAAADGASKATYIVSGNVKNCALDLECVRVCPTGAIEIIPK